MRIQVHVGLIPKVHLEQKALKTLLKIYPEGDRGRSFHCILNENDERLSKILKCLKDFGLFPRLSDESENESQNGYRFRLEKERIYESIDFGLVNLFEPVAKISLETVKRRTSDGLLIVTSDFEGQPPQLGWVHEPGKTTYAVTHSIKLLMEQADLKGIQFFPAKVMGHKAKQVREQYWELVTNLRMPRLSPGLHLIDGIGGLYEDGKSHACIVKDGFTPAEMRYRSSDLAKLGPFDLARTHEPNGGKAGTFVASKRFYDFCQAEKLEIDWIPVRIDPD